MIASLQRRIAPTAGRSLWPLVTLVWLGCGGGPEAPDSEGVAPAGPRVEGPALLTETTSLLPEIATRREFPDGNYFYAQVIVSGLALLDYDNDSDLDLIQVRAPVPGDEGQPWGTGGVPAPNLLLQQQPDGTFVDVTAASGLGDPGYGVGVAVGDTNNDGYLDVYFTNIGPDSFYEGRPDGTFENRTAAAGFSKNEWSSSAAFADYDRDGDLDLYVVHYVVFDPEVICPPPITSEEGLKRTVENPRRILTTPTRVFGFVRNYCAPLRYEAPLDALYRNNGDGTFTEVTAEAGITMPGRGLGVVATDLTGDGWTDFLVSNDQEENHLWVNQQDGTFQEEAVLRGLAVNAQGEPEASMGLAVGDVTGSGRLAVLMTHLRKQTNTLYLDIGEGLFFDETEATGMPAVDLMRTGWGTAFLDLDHDGDLDLAVVNGSVRRNELVPGGEMSEFWNYFVEPNLLFLNDGRARFTDVSARAGSFGSFPESSRGLAVGDIDNDGDLDLASSNIDGTTRLYRNDAPPTENHWLMVRALTGARDAIGAQVRLSVSGTELLRVVLPSQSYASSSDPRVHFGLGPTEVVDSLTITWPDGSLETFEVPGVDRQLVCRQNGGCEEL